MDDGHRFMAAPIQMRWLANVFCRSGSAVPGVYGRANLIEGSATRVETIGESPLSLANFTHGSHHPLLVAGEERIVTRDVLTAAVATDSVCDFRDLSNAVVRPFRIGVIREDFLAQNVGRVDSVPGDGMVALFVGNRDPTEVYGPESYRHGHRRGGGQETSAGVLLPAQIGYSHYRSI